MHPLALLIRSCVCPFEPPNNMLKGIIFVSQTTMIFPDIFQRYSGTIAKSGSILPEVACAGTFRCVCNRKFVERDLMVNKN